MNSSGDVFLTGATGFSGPAVLKALRQSGRSVVALVRRQVKLDGVKTIVGNISQVTDLERRVAEAAAVVHLASARTQDRDTVIGEDVYGTSRLLDGWQRGPFIFASSVTVHGIPRQTLTESVPIDIIDWYDMGKYMNEFQLRDAVRTPLGSRGPAVSLRPTVFLGDNDRRNDRQILGMLYQCYAEGLTFVFESEEALEKTGVSYVSVDDFGRAIVASLGLVDSAQFEIATGFITWRELIELVARFAGKPAKIEVRPGVISEIEFNPGKKQIRLPHSRTEQDASAFFAASGWQPSEFIEELVERYVKAELKKS